MANQPRVFNFMRLRWVSACLSIVAVLSAIVSLAVNGISFGLDFTGGSQIEIEYEQTVELKSVRDTLAQAGYENAVVVHFGSDRDVLVRLPQGIEKLLGVKNDEVGAHTLAVLQQASGQQVELRRIEFVGPQVGEQLKEQGGLAMLLALGVVMVYIAMRFQLKFAIGAVVALAHDVLITLGIFSFWQLDFDLTVLAALLAVIGYSLNDTIVVADRIRENFRKLRIGDGVEIINISLTETLGRTTITSGTTLLVLLALFIFGGTTIHNFSLALLAGITVGTYSSIYVAAALLLALKIDRQDLIVPTREELLDDGRP